MSPRLRKFIGLIAILAFCAFYVVVVSTLGDYLPSHWAVRLIYYAVAGTAWGVPLFPLIRWMNREPRPRA
ncbi:MAG TPA: DUF2842 domain-containing protein [Phenylobacterium sp.]